ncbi:MAG: hypothetical protein HC939_05420 [Pleurocapsa sp. SU_5_0]|nr:hypothetical protein [Pleurocapsa sp. SU_5_0]NJO96985.1 hypothetical protein [Pleurocapsa sp. CRU_1_2]
MLIICPGIHTPELTEQFIQGIQDTVKQDYLILPTEYLPYSAIAVTQWLNQQSLSKSESLSFISFSAGVVGSFGAAWGWQLEGGQISNFIAVDGWGMPLIANFPFHRVSHDYFTHWSSSILGAGQQGFYADPGVEHLELWRSPKISYGWRIIAPGQKTRDNLANYLGDVLNS